MLPRPAHPQPSQPPGSARCARPRPSTRWLALADAGWRRSGRDGVTSLRLLPPWSFIDPTTTVPAPRPTRTGARPTSREADCVHTFSADPTLNCYSYFSFHEDTNLSIRPFQREEPNAQSFYPRKCVFFSSILGGCGSITFSAQSLKKIHIKKK